MQLLGTHLNRRSNNTAKKGGKKNTKRKGKNAAAPYLCSRTVLSLFPNSPGRPRDGNPAPSPGRAWVRDALLSQTLGCLEHFDDLEL